MTRTHQTLELYCHNLIYGTVSRNIIYLLFLNSEFMSYVLSLKLWVSEWCDHVTEVLYQNDMVALNMAMSSYVVLEILFFRSRNEL